MLSVLLGTPSTAAALCGDLTGDGRLAASDALASLKTVVTGGYHAGGDLDTGSGTDGVLTVTDALALLRAATQGEIPPCAAAVERRLLVATSAIDFANGGLAELALEDFSVLRSRRSFTDGDSVLRLQEGRTLILNRFAANNLQEIDCTSNGFTTAMQCSLGVGANPHDVVLVSRDKGYVSRYDKPNLAIIDFTVDSSCSGFVTKLVSLAALADDDGIPEMDQMLLVGDRLFVALQLLDRPRFFVPTGPGLLAVLDTASDELVDSVQLTISNPFAETKGLIFHEPSGRIYVGGPGTLYTDLGDGGIEIVNPETLLSEGVVMTGAELGGDLTDFVIVGTRRAYALVAAEGFIASLVEVDLATRTVVDVLATSEFSLSDIELSEAGLLCLADRDPFEPGVRCWDISDNRELTEGPVYPGLSPFNLTFTR
jgi:hypothetical protein